MDYEAIDREMSSYVVSTVKNGTRFYLTDDGVASDRLSNARHVRWEEHAWEVARSANQEYAWHGFTWEPLNYPAALVAGD